MSEIRNDDAEINILGILMEYPDSIHEITGKLTKDDFYHARHKLIFEAMCQLQDDRVMLDSGVVIEKLRATNKLDLCGGSGYVSGLTSGIVSKANLGWYITNAVEARNRRVLEALGADLGRMSAQQDLSVEQVLEHADKMTTSIFDRQEDGYKKASEYAAPFIAEKEANFANRGKLKGVPTGLKWIDDLTGGYCESDFVLIGARPSVGKTTFLLQGIVEAGLRHNMPIGVFSLEMPGVKILNRMCANIEGIHGNSIKSGMYGGPQFAAFNNFAEMLIRSNIVINEKGGIYINELEAEVRKMKRKDKVRAIYIDYLGLIRHPNEKLERWRQVSDISIRLKNLTKELKIPIICVVALGRDDENKLPTLKSISDTKQLEYDADLVIFLHRDGEPNPTDDRLKMIVAKQRDGDLDMSDIVHKKGYFKMIELEKDNFS